MNRERSFDALYNEGGEGYNPFRGEARRPAAKPVQQNKGRLLMYKGLPHDESKLRAKLADSEARLINVTDPTGQQIISAEIAALRAALV